MFDRIARRYDLLNRVLSFGNDQRWRRRAVRSLDLDPARPARVLDLATGTADLAILIARTHPAAKVIGVDPAERMLEEGRRKVEAAGLADRVELVPGDAETLPFPEAHFDAVTIAFGIRNVPDRLRGLREMARVTRPGGVAEQLGRHGHRQRPAEAGTKRRNRNVERDVQDLHPHAVGRNARRPQSLPPGPVREPCPR